MLHGINCFDITRRSNQEPLKFSASYLLFAKSFLLPDCDWSSLFCQKSLPMIRYIDDYWFVRLVMFELVQIKFVLCYDI